MLHCIGAQAERTEEEQDALHSVNVWPFQQMAGLSYFINQKGFVATIAIPPVIWC